MVADIRKYLTVCNDMKDEAHKNSVGLKKLMVTEVREKKNGFINPVLVSFQNGKLNDNQLSSFKVTLTANKNGETNAEVEAPYKHVFKDSNSGEIPRKKQIIAIRNRKTNKVKIVEVDSAILINSALLHSPVANKTETDYKKEIQNLNRTFGGKKIVSHLEQRDKLNISSMPIADEVKKAVEDIKVENTNISLNETETESILHLLPPCHRDAVKVSGVYILSEILSDDELKELKTESDRLEGSEFNPEDYSEFYRQCYEETKTSAENLDERLAGILFIEVLIQFLKMPSKKLAVKRAVFCQFSYVIHEKLVNEFCVKTDSSISRPMTMRDKCLCYIIAICLICCNYKLNLKVLSTTTAVQLARLTRLARMVGAVPVSKEDNTFVLKLPLPALPISSAKRGRRSTFSRQTNLNEMADLSRQEIARMISQQSEDGFMDALAIELEDLAYQGFDPKHLLKTLYKRGKSAGRSIPEITSDLKTLALIGTVRGSSVTKVAGKSTQAAANFLNRTKQMYQIIDGRPRTNSDATLPRISAMFAAAISKNLCSKSVVIEKI